MASFGHKCVRSLSKPLPFLFYTYQQNIVAQQLASLQKRNAANMAHQVFQVLPDSPVVPLVPLVPVGNQVQMVVQEVPEILVVPDPLLVPDRPEFLAADRHTAHHPSRFVLGLQERQEPQEFPARTTEPLMS